MLSAVSSNDLVAQKFLLFGSKNNTDLIIANYDYKTSSFQSLKSTDIGEIIVATATTAITPQKAEFINANIGYISISRNLEDSLFYKTNDGGYSWSSVVATGTQTTPIFQIINETSLVIAIFF